MKDALIYKTKEQLKYMADPARRFITKHQAFVEKHGVDIPPKTLQSKTKAADIDCIGAIFSNREILTEFAKKEIGEFGSFMIERIIKQGYVTADEIFAETGEDVFEQEVSTYISYYDAVRAVKEPYQFFNASFSYKREGYTRDKIELRDKYYFWFDFPYAILKRLKSLYLPEGSKVLKGKARMPKLSENQIAFNGETDILTELPRLLEYVSKTDLKLSMAGRITAATGKRMGKQLGIREFYPDETKLKHLKCYFIAAFLRNELYDQNQPEHWHEVVRDIVQNMVVGKKTFHYQFSYAAIMLPNLKPSSMVEGKSDDPSIRLNALHAIPSNEWVSLEAWQNYLDAHEFSFEPISPREAASCLSYKNHRDYSGYEYINEATYPNLVRYPLSKALLFALAAFGCAELIYETPDLTEFDDTYYSFFDGLLHFRLTALGEYALGRTNSYTPSETVGESKLKLDEHTLLIKAELEHIDTYKKMLDSFAVRISDQCYKVTFSSFMDGCKNKEDVFNKIALFKSIVTDMPQNWESFFQSIMQKCNPLTEMRDVHVFEINMNNEALLHILAKDASIKPLINKAEGHRIIVPNKNLAKLKNILKKEHGYLL